MSGDNQPSREILDAFIDGQLSQDEMTRVAALVAKNHDLQAYVERQHALRTHLEAAFSPILAEALPDSLQQTLLQTRISPLWQFLAALKSGQRWLAQGPLWRLAIPAAAAVALGLAVGIAIDRAPVSELPFFRNATNGAMIAQGALEHALNEQLASDDNRASPARVGVSFRNKNGEDCRTFALSGTRTSTSGVACRTGGDWVVGALASSTETPAVASPYEMAGAAMPGVIRNLVNQMIAGAPFDSTAERKARARHWQGGRRE